MGLKCECGAPRHRYSKAFVKSWKEAMRFYPLYALPEPTACGRCAEKLAARTNVCATCGSTKASHRVACDECIRYMRGEAVGAFYRARRKAWLRSTTPVPSLDMKDKDVLRQLRQGAKAAKAFKKLVKQQKEKMLRIRTKRFMKREMKQFKKRDKAIREVLEQAACPCGGSHRSFEHAEAEEARLKYG